MGRDVQQQTDSSQRGHSNLMERRERDVEEQERASMADREEKRRLAFCLCVRVREGEDMAAIFCMDACN